MIYNLIKLYFNFDALALTLICLVSFIGLCVWSFAYRYMAGDLKYYPFLIKIIGLIIAISLMVSSDNLILFFISWCLSNALLVQLMIHKPSWQAARASGQLAARNYLLGAVCLLLSFTGFYLLTGQMSIQAIIQQTGHSNYILWPLLLILCAAMTQSAIYPFHGWLLSSLNSPTPVSALMHAGLVNGGGFLIVRFAPLYLQFPQLMLIIFVIGMLSALLGTLWKLMQHDIKRMLACSTLGQMGFMLAQCGLGLFPAAIAHLVWHGMFKAYLFLASGSAAQEKRLVLNYPPKILPFIYSLIYGWIGSLGFAYASGKSWLAGDTTLVVMIIAFIAASQLALSLFTLTKKLFSPIILLATLISGLIYGFNVQIIAAIIKPLNLMQPQMLNVFHILAIALLIFGWLAMLAIKSIPKPPAWLIKAYVWALNASQPQPQTITAHRNHYQYI